MDPTRLGSIFRAVRIRQGWRQSDVAQRARVSASTVSRAERGRFDGLSVGTVGAVAAALDVRLEWTAYWRGGELDRMLRAGHSAMHEHVARLLTAAGWEVAPEVSFSIYGERGVIDVLARHPTAGSLLVVELKTQLVDVQGLLGAVDRYRRLAPRIAADRGWSVGPVSTWVVMQDSATNRRRVAAHASVLRAAFTRDGRHIGPWLRSPSGLVHALSFLAISRQETRIGDSSAVQRVRLRR